MDQASTERVERRYLLSLFHRQTLPDFVRVSVDDMTTAAYKAILQSIYDCEEAYGIWDWATVCALMYQNASPHTGIMEELGYDQELLGDSDSRAAMIKRFALERRYSECAQRIVAAQKDGRYMDALEIAESMTEIKPLKKEGFESLDLADIVAAAKAEMRENIRGSGGRLKFGEPLLDRVIGGIPMGGMLTIGGVTSAGKSSFALYLSVLMAQAGKRVGILSLEDPKTLWGDRTMGLLGDVRISWLLGGVDLGEEALAELAEKGGIAELKARGLAIRVTLCTGASVAEAISESKKLIKNYEPDVLVVDYVQAARFNLKIGARYDKLIADFAKALKGLCVRSNIPLILLSQIRRLEKGEEPTIFHLKESGDLENESDVVLLLWQPMIDGEERSIGKIGKIKWGMRGLRFEMIRDPSHGMIDEVQEWQGNRT